jgi:hypothetical protein
MTLPLFDRYAPGDITASRHRGAETSEEAHAKIAPTLADQRERVYAFIRSRGHTGATGEEVAIALEMRVHSVSGRVSELLRDARVYTDGRKRQTSSGCNARVLLAAEAERTP